ncbi:MAG: cytochrome c [Gammaproteobacteria bacterium]|nr:cytochrome c [Gammaproteobacteria bacterium]
MTVLRNISKTSLLKLIPVTFAAFIWVTPASAGDAAAGKVIYDGKGACAICHGATGAGDGVASAAFNPKLASFVIPAFRLDTDGDGNSGTDTDLSNAIINGAAKYGGNAGMPGRADFSDTEVNDLIAYIRSLQK